MNNSKTNHAETNHAETLAAYCAYFANLTLENMDGLDALVTPDVMFEDPFHRLQGVDNFKKVLLNSQKLVKNARYLVDDSAMGKADGDSQSGYLRWRLTGTSPKSGKNIRIIGMSEVRFAPDGRINIHIDHWDASQQIYRHIPVFGWIMAKIRAKIAAHCTA